jgi:hypothetical protein
MKTKVKVLRHRISKVRDATTYYVLLAVLFSAIAVFRNCPIPTFSASIVTLFGKSLSNNFSDFAGSATVNEFRPPGVRKSVPAILDVSNVTWLLASSA